MGEWLVINPHIADEECHAPGETVVRVPFANWPTALANLINCSLTPRPVLVLLTGSMEPGWAEPMRRALEHHAVVSPLVRGSGAVTPEPHWETVCPYAWAAWSTTLTAIGIEERIRIFAHRRMAALLPEQIGVCADAVVTPTVTIGSTTELGKLYYEQLTEDNAITALIADRGGDPQ